SPFRIGIGEDDKFYINDFSTAGAMTYQVDGDVTTSTQVLTDIGETTNPPLHTDASSTPVVKGSLAGGNLTLYNTDGAHPGSNNWVLRYDIGSGPLPSSVAPVEQGSAGFTSVADLTCDFDIGT